MWNELLKEIKNENRKSLARAVSLVENGYEGYFSFLQSLENNHTPVIGITGPPGAGKSTLTDALIEELTITGKKVAVLCIDPTSPFSNGALLGDRIRMNKWYSHPGVYIRSLASRGNAGGVNPKIIEITGLMQCADFDYIIIETVGAGQNEVEIAGIADVTVVVLVPDSGDDIQALKSGLMEIADIFVVNKSDRPAADIFTKNLRNALTVYNSTVPVLQTIATSKKNIQHLTNSIDERLQYISDNKKISLIAHKAFYLIREMRMKNISKEKLKEEISESMNKDEFNFYSFVAAHV